MKNIKKLLSIVMVLTLVLALGSQAFAATVTIDEKLDGHTFTAYQIFTGTQAEDQDNELASVEWGADIDAAKFVEALKKLDGTTFAACNAADPQTVVKALNAKKDDSDFAKQVAEAAFDSLKEGAKGVSFDKTTTLANGYYLIQDTTVGLDGDAAYNDVVLQVTENVTIQYKTDVPKSEKKVQDITDIDGKQTDWQESADWDIGDDVPFQLTGTLPSNYGDYDSYAITFHDKQSAGLTFDPDTVVVKVGTKTLTKDSEYTVKTPGSEEGCTFEIVIPDLKKSAPEATSASIIEVTYKSTLNTNATVGITGNPNSMTMGFSNNPHGTGTGTTPEDKAIVFTFDYDVDKVDGEGQPLEGAEFTLYKEVPKAEGTVPLKDDGNPYEEDEEIPEDAKYYVALTGDNALKMQESGTDFYAKGLDDGNYVVLETKVPNGYNKANPVKFTITANHDIESDGQMTADQLVVTGVDATPTGGYSKIENLSGLELPETGGIGTTIFYVVGGILVAAAVILLVTKRRVSGAEK